MKASRLFFNVCEHLEDCLSFIEAPLFDDGELGSAFVLSSFQRLVIQGELQPSMKRQLFPAYDRRISELMWLMYKQQRELQ
jgi:hypothetical protein